MLVLAVFLILTFFLGHYQAINFINHQGDTAMFLDIVENTAMHGVPTTRVNAAVLEANPTWDADTRDAICADPLKPFAYSDSAMQINQLRRHAYLIVYALAPLTWLMPTPVVVAALSVLAFTLISLAAYGVLRLNRTPPLAAGVFAVITIVHPAWSQSIFGQFYSDRFFMVFAFLYAVLMHEMLYRGRPPSRALVSSLFVCGLLASATTERGAIMLGGFSLAYVVLFWRHVRDHRLTRPIVAFGLALLAYAVLYLVLFNTNDSNIGQKAGSLIHLPASLRDPKALIQVAYFLTINVLLYGLVALYNWRLALIAFGAMLPNIVIPYTEAYQSVFVTHYHSMYFPFLVFASLYGYQAYWSKMGTAVVRYAALLPPIVAGGCLATIEIRPGGIGFASANALTIAPVRMLRPEWYGDTSSEVAIAKQLKAIDVAIPRGASVSAPEALFPALYRDHFLYYYPIGIDTAQYVALPALSSPDGHAYFGGAIGYQVDAMDLGQCLTRRLRGDGYDLDHAVTIGGIAILKRVAPKTDVTDSPIPSTFPK